MVWRRIGDESFECKPLHARDKDVRTPVRELLRRINVRYASHGSGRDLALIDVIRPVDDPEPTVTVQAIGEQTSVPRLEDVQWERSPREEDEREGKEWEESDGHDSKVMFRSRGRKSDRGCRKNNAAPKACSGAASA
jgi:hypothetical protein